MRRGGCAPLSGSLFGSTLARLNAEIFPSQALEAKVTRRLMGLLCGWESVEWRTKRRLPDFMIIGWSIGSKYLCSRIRNYYTNGQMCWPMYSLRLAS